MGPLFGLFKERVPSISMSSLRWIMAILIRGLQMKISGNSIRMIKV